MNETRHEPNEQERDAQVRAKVRAAQNGSEDAFTELFRAYTPLIDRLVARFSDERISEDELRSDAIDAFTTAVSRFDTEQSGVTFGLYARICIENRLISALRASRHIPGTVSLDALDPDSLAAGEESDPAHALMEAERYAELCRRMETVLSRTEREVWMLLISGLTAGQIAEQLGIDRKSVENALFRARRKLRESFSEH